MHSKEGLPGGRQSCATATNEQGNMTEALCLHTLTMPFQLKAPLRLEMKPGARARARSKGKGKVSVCGWRLGFGRVHTQLLHRSIAGGRHDSLFAGRQLLARRLVANQVPAPTIRPVVGGVSLLLRAVPVAQHFIPCHALQGVAEETPLKQAHCQGEVSSPHADAASLRL